MRFAALVPGLALALAAAACTDDAPTPQLPPELKVLSPARGLMQPGLSTVEVAGVVSANPETQVAVASVTVNGVTAAVGTDGTFRAQVPVHAGANLLHTVAVGTDGAEQSDTRAVLTGTMQPLDTAVDNAMRAGLSKAAFTRLGTFAGDQIAAANLSALLMPLNPVVAKGLDNGQEDCLYGKVSVRPGIDMTDANIQFTPTAAGLTLDATFDRVVAPLHARYAAACLDGDTDITIRATQIRIRGNLAATVSGGRVHVKLANPQVTLTGFDLQASGLPGAVLDLLDLDQEIGNIMASATEKFVGPMVEKAIEGVKVGEQHLSILGKDLAINVAASGVHFDPTGADIVLDTSMVVGGAPASASYLYTDNQTPPARTNTGIELALADDAINQLMAGFWASGAIDRTIVQDLGLADAIALKAKLPPVVSTSADGSMHLTVGDLMATMTKGGVPTTTLAINLEVALKAEPSPLSPGLVKLTLGLPTLTTDVVEDTSGLDSVGLGRIMPQLVQLQLEGFAPILGSIPLPSVAGLNPVDVHVGGKGGYVTLAAGIQ
jgi:Glucodextranase, domain B